MTSLTDLDRYEAELMGTIQELDSKWKDWTKVPRKTWEAAGKLETSIVRYAGYENWKGFSWALTAWKKIFLDWISAQKPKEVQRSTNADLTAPQPPAQGSIFEVRA